MSKGKITVMQDVERNGCGLFLRHYLNITPPMVSPPYRGGGV
jgi:hypothetical protein